MKQLSIPIVLALCACQPSTETSETADDNVASLEVGNNAAANDPQNLQQFVNEVAASDAFEIASSELALEKSQSARVRQFAQMMIDGHRKSTAELKAAVAELDGAPDPDPTLSATQQQSMDQLEAARGAAFDQAYVAAQIDGHQKALTLLETQAAADGNPLAAFAAKTAPIVAKHLQEAQGLK